MLSGSVKKVNTPRIIQEPTVSPGCTLAVIITPFRFLKFSKLSAAVIVSNSQASPESVRQRVDLRTSLARWGSYSIAARSLRKSEYVYGTE